jgi:trimethyllysine dioxygenase
VVDRSQYLTAQDGGFWDFTSDMSKGDLAYSSEGLPAHTDTTYFTDPAGLQIFHMLSHPAPGQGGSTLLVDSFRAAKRLKDTDPEAYALLSRLGTPAHASGTPGNLLRPMANHAVFTHDHAGRLVQTRWNNEDRGVIGDGWTPEEVRQWYAAMKTFDEILQKGEYWVKLQPGNVVGTFVLVVHR